MEEPKWKKFEKLVAKIQKDLSPDAEVLLDQKLEGRESKVKRQIDVLVKRRVGQFNILIAIDCKDYSSPVDVKDIEEVVGLFKDVGIQKGAIVAAKGFTEAAKSRGKSVGLELFNLVDCGEHDWKVELKIPVLYNFSQLSKYNLLIRGHGVVNFRCEDPLHLEILDKENQCIGTVKDMLVKRWREGKIPQESGEYKNFDFIGHPVRIQFEGRFLDVYVTANLYVEKKLFLDMHPVEELSGFEDVLAGGVVTRGFTSGSIDLERIPKGCLLVKSRADLAIQPLLEFAITSP